MTEYLDKRIDTFCLKGPYGLNRDYKFFWMGFGDRKTFSDIRYWMGLLPECSLDPVNRERNQAADILAKKAKEDVNLSVIHYVPPSYLIMYLYEPFTI